MTYEEQLEQFFANFEVVKFTHPTEIANKKNNVESVKDKCGKCGGVGRIDAFKHRANGICYKCNGSGKK